MQSMNGTTQAHEAQIAQYDESAEAMNRLSVEYQRIERYLNQLDGIETQRGSLSPSEEARYDDLSARQFAINAELTRLSF